MVCRSSVRGKWLLASPVVVCAAAPCPAYAADDIWFNLPAGPLNVALISLATQAGVSIDISDPALRSIRVAGLRGRFSLREGLRRLLKDTGYGFRISRGNVVRLRRQPDPHIRTRDRDRVAPSRPPPPPA
ncbi:STN domain-containing protein, partial [Sphingomonas sp. 3-13AW]|uniref:STN domain-containing protein n=1 Tax=Sphingomonas sp. 3-13AW TaxID=3050450 RepID=UPI003BB70053